MSAEAVAIQAVSRVPSRRFGLNLISNVGQLGLTMVVGALYVPFLVRQLGPAVYGLVPLISLVSSYMALVTVGFNYAMGRSLVVALARDDHLQANSVFNVGFWANVGLSVILAVLAIFMIVWVDELLRIPAGYESATRWLLAGAAAALLLNQVKAPFGVSSFSRNRLDLANLVSVCETLTRVGLVVCLFSLLTPKLEYIGIAIFLGTVVSAVGMIKLWKTLTPNLRISLRHFDWKLMKGLSSTSGWVLVSQLGTLMYLNIDLLLANRLFGPEQSGRYAAVLQVPYLLRTVAFAVGGIFPPTMFNLYAQGKMDELVDYLHRAIKFLGLVMALCIGLICGFSELLLSLWLGPEFENLAALLFIMTVHLCLDLSMYPLYAVPLAANRVRVPGLITLGFGLGNVLLALILAQMCGWGLYGLAAAGAIVLTIKYFVFIPVYAARILGRPYPTFFRSVLPMVLATAVTIGLCRLMLWRLAISTWSELALAAMAVSLLFLSFVYSLLTPQERIALKDAALRFRTES
jgi:membrane protein EpsK